MHLKTLATATAGKDYETEEEFDYDRETNFAMLAYDLDRSRQEVLNESKDITKSIQFSSPVEVLWYTRDMFDTFVRISNNGTGDDNELKSLIEAVQINIAEIVSFYTEMHDKTSIKERITLRLIQTEVDNEYDKYFNQGKLIN